MKEYLKKDWPSYLIATGLMAVVIYKAIFLSMTHDESASFNYFNHKDVVFYLFDSGVWSNANNHWINTLSFQLFTRVFGVHEWAIRLGSMLAFVIYAWYSIRLLKDIDAPSLRILGLLLMLGNPYALDFFSVARGYSMSMAFTTGAMYYFTQFVKKEANKDLVKGLIMLLLATLSLFSSIIFFPAMLGGLVLYLVSKNRIGVLKRKLVKPIGLMALIFGFTLILTYIPLTTLSKNAEFKWGAKTFYDCFKSLVWHSSYGKINAPEDKVVMFIIVLLLAVFALRSLRFLKKPRLNSTFLLSISTLVLLILGTVIARHTVGTYYPVERKTIMFIPFIGLITAYGLDSFRAKPVNILGYVLGLGLVIHLWLSVKPDTVREWWYDRDTKAFITQIVEDNVHKPTVIGCHWMFHPTLTFYANEKYPGIVKVGNYSKSINTKDDFDYFICFNSEYDLLKDRYDKLFDPPTGRMILKYKK